jgi:brefeldin A-inhibited guanine nucleotide-exchange protein
MNQITLKVSFLEIISVLTQKPPEILAESSDFINFLRNSVMHNVIDNSASQHPRIMYLSLTIFYHIMKSYREHFQEEIPLFIDDVVLKMLDSVNNKAEVKQHLLKFLGNLVEHSKLLIEFFLNFDCNPNSMPVVERIVYTLSRISQGKFSKQEYTVTIQKEQERDLRKSAGDYLLKMIGNLEALVQKQLRKNQRILTGRAESGFTDAEKAVVSELNKYPLFKVESSSRSKPQQPSRRPSLSSI